MQFLDDLIKQHADNKELKRKLVYIKYLYEQIATEENVEDLDELIKTLVESFAVDTPKLVRVDSDILKAFYDYLLASGKKKSVAYDYVKRIERVCREFNITPEDLYYGRASYSIKDLLGMYCAGGIRYEENVKKHNAISAALKRFLEFMENADKDFDPIESTDRHIYLSYSQGYQSFEVINKHVCGYTIKDRDVQIVYKENRVIVDTVRKVISENNYARLISVMSRYKKLLSRNTTPAFIQFPHGGVGSYQYSFDELSNYSGCAQLFDSDDRQLLDEAYKDFRKVLDDIIAE